MIIGSEHWSCITSKEWSLLYDVGIISNNVDEAITALRLKGIYIYATIPPFMSSITGKVMYSYAVKKISKSWPYNGRQQIYRSPCKTNIWDAKRAAIRAACKWILSHKSQEKAKIVKLKRKDATSC